MVLGGIVLKILRLSLSIAAFGLAVYGLVTRNFEFNSIMIFLLGLTMLVMGIEEIQKGRKGLSLWLFGVFSFLLFVSIQGFLLN